MKRFLSLSAVALAALLFSAPAHAQTRGWLDNGAGYAAPDRQSFYDSRRVAYDNGFSEGVKQGEKDARKNKPFAYQDERTYQRADKGYHREFGTIALAVQRVERVEADHRQRDIEMPEGREQYVGFDATYQ